MFPRSLARLLAVSFVVNAIPLNLPSRTIPLPQLEASQIPSPTPSRPISAKIVETTLAILSLAFVALTHYVLISTSRRLSSTSKLPMRCIKHNMAAILQLAWPDVSDSTQSLAEEYKEKGQLPKGKGKTPNVKQNEPADAVRLLYCGEMVEDSSIGTRVARGIKQCRATAEKRLHTPLLWLTNGSSSTSSMVSLVIWEWVVIWIVALMFVVTLFHNGLIIGPLGPDAILRLIIALTYVVAYAAHATFVWRSCKTWFTSVTAGASWSMLNRARFGVLDVADYDYKLSKPIDHRPLPFREVSQASKDFKQETFEATLAHDAFPEEEVDSRRPPSLHVSRSSNSNETTVLSYPTRKAPENAVQNVDQMKRGEAANTVKAANNALQRIIANGMLVATVTIASGYLVWSTDQNAANSQLGSLGLLASLSTGGAAMFTSAVQLQTANSSFEQLLLMKEILINGQAEEFSTRREPLHPPISFMQKTAAMHQIRMRDFVRIKNAWDVMFFLLFGPGWFLLPTQADQMNKSDVAEYEVSLNVRGQNILFTTASTDRHSKGEGGKNVQAINVCFEG